MLGCQDDIAAEGFAPPALDDAHLSVPPRNCYNAGPDMRRLYLECQDDVAAELSVYSSDAAFEPAAAIVPADLHSDAVSRLREQVDRLRQDKKVLQRTVQRTKQRKVSQDACVVGLKAKVSELQLVGQTDDNTGVKAQTSCSNSMLVALTKNVAHASLRAAAAFVRGEVCINTIRSWEVKAATCLLTEAYSWHRDCEERVHDLSESAGPYAVAAHRFRSDGTNHASFQQHAMQTCQVVSFYDFGHGDTSRLSIWPDCLPQTSKTGEFCFNLTGKQCGLVGAPIYFETGIDNLQKDTLRWIVAVTDAGPDQVGNRKRLRAKWRQRRHRRTLWVEQNCLQHEQSNGNKFHLELCDVLSSRWGFPFKYFASLAKFANLLRHKFLTLKNRWTKFYARDSARQKVFKSLCPKPICTRWGSTGDCERYIIALDGTNFLNVLMDTFDAEGDEKCLRRPSKGKSGKGGKGTTGKGKFGKGKNNKGKVRKHVLKETSTGPSDEIALDAQAHFQEMQGRYRKETMTTVSDTRWWSFVELAHTTREPWNHFMNYLQSDARKKHGAWCTTIAVIVRFKSAQFLQIFEDLIHSGIAWWDRHVAKLQDIDPDIEPKVVESVVSLSLNGHSEFRRRIHKICTEFPHRLLNLGQELPPSVRACTAQDLINADERALDATTVKFRKLHAAALRDVAEAEGLSYNRFMCSAVDALRKALCADTQEIESANKCVTKQGQLAPGGKEELVAARLTTSKSIFEENNGSDKVEYAVLTDLAHACENQCKTADYCRIAADTSRFLVPSGPPAVPPLCDILKPHVEALQDVDRDEVLEEAPAPAAAAAAADELPADDEDPLPSYDPKLLWAAPFNMVWSHKSPKSLLTARQALRFTMPDGMQQYWLCCNKFRDLGQRNDSSKLIEFFSSQCAFLSTLPRESRWIL